MSLDQTLPQAGVRPQVAVVPVAGLGTRLRPLTDTLPKELLPLGRQTVLERVLNELAAAGVPRIAFVVSAVKESLLRARFGTRSEGVAIEYALQPEMRGLGDAVLCARPYLEGEASLLVALGDAVLAETSPGALARRLVDAPAPLALAVQRVAREKLSRYGIVATPPASAPITGGQGAAGETFPICGLVEKPAPEDAPSEWAVAARYKLPAAIFDALKRTPPGKGGEVQLTDAIAALLAAGTPADAVPLLPGEMRHDIGSFETYFKAFAAFALADPEHGASLRRFLEETLAMQHLPRAQEAA